MVDGIAGVDEARGLVYFLATLDGPTERHLYVASLDGGEPRRITDAAGMHSVVIDHASAAFRGHPSCRRCAADRYIALACRRRATPHDL